MGRERTDRKAGLQIRRLIMTHFVTQDRRAVFFIDYLA